MDMGNMTCILLTLTLVRTTTAVIERETTSKMKEGGRKTDILIVQKAWKLFDFKEFM